MNKIRIKLSIFIFVFIMTQFIHCDKRNNFIEPTTDFSINFINLPQAWQVSQGENVHIGIVYPQRDTATNWVQQTAALAPRANVSRMSKAEFLSSASRAIPYDIVLIMESFASSDYDDMLKAIQHYTGSGTTIILPAYFGPMRKDYDYSGWREFVQQASEIGAVVVGAHGISYQLGNLSFWRNIPVDIFALHRGIRSGHYLDFDASIEENLEESAYLVAGVAALMVSKDPDISPSQIKRQFRQKGRKIKWIVTEHRKTAYPTWNGRTMDEFEKKIKNSKIIETFEGACLDAGLVLGLEPLVKGQMITKKLNIRKGLLQPLSIPLEMVRMSSV